MEMHEEMGGGKEEKMSDKVKDYPPYLDYPKERKPMTNADRIRAMTDDELTMWIMEMQSCPYERYQDCQHPNYDCETCVKDWLKQEAE